MLLQHLTGANLCVPTVFCCHPAPEQTVHNAHLTAKNYSQYCTLFVHHRLSAVLVEFKSEGTALPEKLITGSSANQEIPHTVLYTQIYGHTHCILLLLFLHISDEKNLYPFFYIRLFIFNFQHMSCGSSSSSNLMSFVTWWGRLLWPPVDIWSYY